MILLYKIYIWCLSKIINKMNTNKKQDYAVCPYDGSHILDKSRMMNHIKKCESQNVKN